MAPDEFKAKKGLPCPKCGNHLRVRPDQAGEEVACPKCGAKFTVGRGSAGKTAATPVNTYEPEVPLKRATIVPEEPVMLETDGPPPEILPMQPPTAAHQPQYEADWATDEMEVEKPHVPPPSMEPDYLEIAKRRGLLRTKDARPIPSWTFFSGVFGFPWREGNILRWVVMSIALLATCELLVVAGLEMRNGVGNSTLLMPILSLVGAGLMLVTGSFCAACFLAAVDDTADGHDDVQADSLPPLGDWFFAFFSVLGIWLMSGALGYPFALVPSIGALAVPISSLVLFPVLLLSAMECDSFFIPWSPRVWGTTLRFAGTWLAFYIVSTFLLAAWLIGTSFALQAAPFASMLLAAPALAAVILIYARLLGRLAWRVTYDPSAGARVARFDDRPTSESTDVAAPRPGKKRKKTRRLKFEMPDEAADARASAPPPGPPVPPRLDFHKRR
ncbi:MAG: hypothetical protein AB7O59_16160 [Pirellulales bacterium]